MGPAHPDAADDFAVVRDDRVSPGHRVQLPVHQMRRTRLQYGLRGELGELGGRYAHHRGRVGLEARRLDGDRSSAVVSEYDLGDTAPVGHRDADSLALGACRFKDRLRGPARDLVAQRFPHIVPFPACYRTHDRFRALKSGEFARLPAPMTTVALSSTTGAGEDIGVPLGRPPSGQWDQGQNGRKPRSRTRTVAAAPTKT